ncbi:dnaJ homolog subfamily C member 18 [Phoenix dactylifera]|uniref:DnaJ homolog subfamily C member 18 n=1 Tax=Phoenix dactylifera TaxID=42345 RepID=A0A8B8ZDE4_PHODC|nr:dnaJ homolog subfamily C member 18 [Phoenix dactylifera]
MQSSFLLPWPSSSERGGGLFLPSRNSLSFVGLWAWAGGRVRRSADRAGPVAAGTGSLGGEQDHYAVLGLPRSASAADVKRAYRLLARKYHPDVSKDLQAGEMFKSIRCAYEVLSDEVSRAQYDVTLKYPRLTGRPQSRRWTRYPDSEEMRRIYRWAELKQRMHHEKQNRQYSWYYQKNPYQENPNHERGSFSEVLRFAFFILFFMQTVGYRASLTICGLMALLDRQLDIGYKTGYIIAWILGGRGGILLTLCINFSSWLCGKNNSSLVALVVVALWVGANLARFGPLPQGAVLTLLYMSIKLQVDLK